MKKTTKAEAENRERVLAGLERLAAAGLKCSLPDPDRDDQRQRFNPAAVRIFVDGDGIWSGTFDVRLGDLDEKQFLSAILAGAYRAGIRQGERQAGDDGIEALLTAFPRLERFIEQTAERIADGKIEAIKNDL